MQTAFAPGKIILSGEYAVVFGYRGVAVPLPIGVRAAFEADDSGLVTLHARNPYVEGIVALCIEKKDLSGHLTITSDIPIGKGLGSSSATVIAVTRALLGDDSRDVAREIENIVSPQSALDFTTIWDNAPTTFQKDHVPQRFELPPSLLEDAILIDSGKPKETTSQLVAWVKSKEGKVQGVLQTIGNCTERLIAGEPYETIVREHHRAQVLLGVVPKRVQAMISAIESAGGSAKVVGAGGRTAGAGLVLALGDIEKIEEIAKEHSMSTMALS